MTDVCRMMPDRFAGFSKDDALRQLAEEQKAEAERKRLEEEARRKAEAERAEAERLRKEAEARGNTGVASLDELTLGSVRFGDCPDRKMNQFDAVRFATQDGILQSAGEAVYARKVLNDAASRDSQRTRTGTFYVVENGNAFVAFDDIADATNNVVLRYAYEGYDENKEGKEFIIRRSLLASVLERAKDTHCFLPVPDNGMAGARVDGNTIPYTNNPYFVAVLGKDLAKVNADLIRGRYVVGMMHLLTSKYVKANVADGEGIVRLVGLSATQHLIDAKGKFDNAARARWVTYDFGGAQ
jgi:hypothetical protein